MVGISSEIIGVIFNLLPGFVTAWIFFGLTAHRRKSPFERTVQALIFTAIIRALVLSIKYLAVLASGWTEIVLGPWTQNVEFVWSIIVAIVLGHLFVVAANRNLYHHLLFKLGITSRTSFPSEWYSAFTSYRGYIVLHLKNRRRLMGWPYEWPDNPDRGHFVIQEPGWLLKDGSEVPVLTDEYILVPATSVEMVEFLKPRSETKVLDQQIVESARTLVELSERRSKSN
jgi:Family of unknown function (DUF6338)